MDKSEATFDKLSELHEQIKSHPYRKNTDEKYLKAYQNLLYDISICFHWLVMGTEFKKAHEMCHDFNGAIMNLGREKYRHLDDCVLHVEQCLGVIHHFVDTHTVPVYFTHYTGANTLKSIPRHRKLDYIGNGNYQLSLTVQQITGAIAEIQAHYPKFPPAEWDTYGIYAKNEYDYLSKILKDI